jgi:hypothetical protein
MADDLPATDSRVEKKEESSPERATRNGETNEEDGMGDGISKRGTGQKQVVEEGTKQKPSKIKEIWGKIGLDVGTLMMMFK